MSATGAFGKIPSFRVIPMAFPVRIGSWSHAELPCLRVSVAVCHAGPELNEKDGFTIRFHLVTVRQLLYGYIYVLLPGVDGSGKPDGSHRCAQRGQALRQFPCLFLLPFPVNRQFVLNLLNAGFGQRHNDSFSAHDTLTFVTA